MFLEIGVNVDIIICSELKTRWKSMNNVLNTKQTENHVTYLTNGFPHNWHKAMQMSPDMKKPTMYVCVCVFRFNVTFNNFLVISRQCLVATGSSVVTIEVLPH